MPLTAANKKELRSVLIETCVYAVLVGAFCFTIFRVWDHPLARLFHDHRPTYAFVAISLMIIQGSVLELAARGIVALFHYSRRKRA